MIRNYLKTAFRTLKKNKGFTFLNIIGLSAGLAACLLIVFYVADELGYDSYNTNSDRIFRVNEDIRFGGNTSDVSTSPAPLAQIVRNTLPEIENAVRIKSSGGIYIKKGNEDIQENKFAYADPALFDVFTLPLLAGDPKTALTAPHSIVISETTAKKYFGKIDNVIGQTLTFNDTANYKVTGLMKDIVRQSHFNFDFFISMPTLSESRETTWLRSNFHTYVLLRKGTRIKDLENKFSNLVNQYVGAELQSVAHLSLANFEKNGNYIRLSLMPLTSIHLESNRSNELGTNGNIQYVYIFSGIGLFILLIACVNFMNLSTACSSNRAIEVGIRKVLGSSRPGLAIQFITESLMITLAATLIAVFAAWALLPVFNQLAGKQMSVTPNLIIYMIPVTAAIVLVIGLLAGSYPAFFLSGFQPITVLKGKLSMGFKGGRLRNFLVVFQFSISIFLIIGTLVIYNQLNYIQTKNLGYDRYQVLEVQNVSALGQQAKIFKQEIKNIPGVVNTTLTGYLPPAGYRSSMSLFQDPALDQKNAIMTQVWNVDEDYISAMGMKLASGRNFSPRMLTDSSAVIINETAAKLMGGEPIGKPLYYTPDLTTKAVVKYQIIGVVHNFNFSSLRSNISPVAFRLKEDQGAISIRIRSTNIPGLIAQIKSKWQSFSPKQQMSYYFMDEDFNATYQSDRRVGGIFLSFTILAILIACLGLFGLAAYAADQRIKEIGIRKVLGANMTAIVGMLSIDFIKLVFIAILIASPAAWFLMNKWLQDFAYRVNIEWWTIAAAGLAALFVTLITISFQSVKAAIANPVKSLRSE